MRFIIEYRVLGELRTAGPYEDGVELRRHLEDIESFSGVKVTRCYPVMEYTSPVKTLQRTKMKSKDADWDF